MAIEEKIAHLGFIQGAINRMGNNSFLIKGWAITLVAAIFALSADNSNKNFSYLAFFPLILFWWLDAYFLHQEKLYRKLYEKVADDLEKSDRFTMATDKVKNEIDGICMVFFSSTLLSFYGLIGGMVLIFILKVIDLIKA